MKPQFNYKNKRKKNTQKCSKDCRSMTFNSKKRGVRGTLEFACAENAPRSAYRKSLVSAVSAANCQSLKVRSNATVAKYLVEFAMSACITRDPCPLSAFVHE